jgi:hypothetical protein
VAVCATVLSTVMVPFTARLGVESVRIARDLVHPRPPEYQKAALGLRDLGLQNGDRLAIVGYPYDCYYARYARLRVVAEIPDEQEFWNLSTPELKSLAEHLASIGVKAVVASNRPDASASADWKDISVRFSVLLLSPQVIKTRWPVTLTSCVGGSLVSETVALFGGPVRLAKKIMLSLPFQLSHIESSFKAVPYQMNAQIDIRTFLLGFPNVGYLRGGSCR